MSSTKTIPIGTERCDVTITWDTGWKFTAKGRCTSIILEAPYGLGNTELYDLYDCKFHPPAKGKDDTSLL